MGLSAEMVASAVVCVLSIYWLWGSGILMARSESLLDHPSLRAPVYTPPQELGLLRRELASYNKASYDKAVQDKGLSYAATKWSSVQRQEIRFEVLANYTGQFRDLAGSSLVDVGCGQGALLKYIADHGPQDMAFAYTGVDVSPSMVVSAGIRFGVVRGRKRKLALKDPQLRSLGDLRRVRLPSHYAKPVFMDGDFLDNRIAPIADYYVCSGCMTIGEQKAWRQVAKAFIAKMGALARKGVYFNMLSTRHHTYMPGFAFYNYEDVLESTKAMFPDATVIGRHDYLEFRDFSIFVAFPEDAGAADSAVDADGA